MKFSINKTECINLLKPLLGIVDNTNPNINFSCFKIITKNKEIVAQACNSLIVCQNKTTNATIEKDGEILIKANLLFDIVSRSSVGSLNFDKVEENVLRISQNAKCFNDINLFELVQFPVLSFVKKETNQMVLPFKTLKEINDKIIPIIQNNQQYNNVYNGISIDSETEKSLIELLGTDTHRLVVLKKDFIGESIKFILPTEVFRAIYSSNTEKDWCLSKEEKNITIGVGDSTYKARLIEGVFPSVSKIIDTPCENAIEINKKAFLEALNRAELIVATEAKPTIKMAIENGVLKLTTRGAVAGSGYEEVEVQQKNQTNISVVFNVRYLQSLVKNINTTKMVMQFNTETMPFLLKEENNNNNIFVVLPIKS